MAKDDDILQQAREAFQLCMDAEAENRAEALDDLRFAKLGQQWPQNVQRKRETEGRPCLTVNRLPSFIRQVVNDARQNKPAITVHPADSLADPETAEIISGLIRNIEYASDADTAYDTALDSAVTSGIGYWTVDIDYAYDDAFDLDIKIKRVADPFTIYGDPYSTGADSSDWNVAFEVEAMPKEQFEQTYKNAEPVDWSSDYSHLKSPWIDGERVLVAAWWTREKVESKLLALSDGSIVDEEAYKAQPEQFAGLQVIRTRPITTHKVKRRLITGAEVLEETDWPGCYIPIVPVYGDEVWDEGKRVLRSLIRDAKDPQRMFNYWRTASTELVALAPKAPFIGPVGAFETDGEKWATANTDTHAYIEYDGPTPPERQPFAGPPAGALQEALNASDDMKSVMGLYDASLGAKSNETSGRAIMARQREGDTSTFHFIDNLSRAIRHCGRILIDLIPKVYNSERVIRVLGIDMQPQTVPLKQPVEMPDEQGNPVQRIFDLGVGKYDLTVEAGPSYTTKREEAATQMVEFLRAMPQAAPVIGDLLAKNLDWPDADEVAKRLQSLLPPQAQGQDPRMMQMQQQMAQMGQQMQAQQQELQAAKTDTAIKQAELQIKARELDIKEFEAQTDRIEAQARIRQDAINAANAHFAPPDMPRQSHG